VSPFLPSLLLVYVPRYISPVISVFLSLML
jgi:hypothetical protein